MDNGNSETSNAIWAIAMIIIVAIVIGGVYYMTERADKKKQIDINVTAPAR